MEKTIYDLKLNEVLELRDNSSLQSVNKQEVQRVPGGWIYRTYSASTSGKSESQVFVPYSEDLKESVYNDPDTPFTA